jgi:hypothetical protein
MQIYRGIRFDVRRFDHGRWQWNVSFTNDNAPRFGGVEDSEDAAVRASEKKIDAWVSKGTIRMVSTE